MLNALAADFVVVLHFAFILFVAMGGLLVFRYPRLMWVHLPAVLWGAIVELAGWFCPLTGIENALRRAGGGGYSVDFIQHYIMPIIYPPGLTRNIQILLGGSVIVINSTIYAIFFLRGRRRKDGQRT